MSNQDRYEILWVCKTSAIFLVWAVLTRGLLDPTSVVFIPTAVLAISFAALLSARCYNLFSLYSNELLVAVMCILSFIIMTTETLLVISNFEQFQQTHTLLVNVKLVSLCFFCAIPLLVIHYKYWRNSY